MIAPRVFFLLLAVTACAADRGPLDWDGVPEEVGSVHSLLSSAQRRVRAGQIRDAARGASITQGWLLAGIADAETQMSHCHSELTWACRGPNSSDCGGGPVVAGAGDGPCSARQGGLGMFQFDGGTFEQTLARDGQRVLSIAGNVEAAVDFTTQMVRNSSYISGVSTKAEAIAWMNGVRIGNSRWDPWIRTVTHYYNGCAPSGSCWRQRYAHYRDHTSGVYNEMGAAFWGDSTSVEDAGTAPSAIFSAAPVSQSFPVARLPFPVPAGSEVAGFVELRNTGNVVWNPGQVFLGTTEPRNTPSAIAGSDWVSTSRAATVAAPVAPGATGRFNFSVRAPAVPGDYSQYFNLVYSDAVVHWFAEPGDTYLQIRVTSEALSCPPNTLAMWACRDSATRQRCTAGRLEVERCPGCESGDCGAPPGDVDEDGHNASVDCNDTDQTIYPGANDLCEDDIDQDCDGIDPDCGEVPSIDADGGFIIDRPDAPVGCEVGCAAGSSPSAFLLIGVFAFATRRRRQS